MAKKPKLLVSKKVARAKSPRSPVQRVTRNIPPKVEVLLSVRAGGRCEFAGCNKYLYEHSLVRTVGNFAEKAHIVAFSKDGPRGSDYRPKDVHAVDNLMLLCAECHKLIDDQPDQYPRSLLETYKKDHEARIYYLTGLGPEKRTTVVQLKARIAGDAVDIPVQHIYTAIAPRYPAETRGQIIDLTDLKVDDLNEYYTLASAQIAREIRALYEPGMSVAKTQHISLFALAQIPLLMFLGRCLSNKIPVDMFQRHRTEEDLWKWPEDGEPVQYKSQLLQQGTDATHVALKLSLSGPIPTERLPTEIDKTFTIYEITLQRLHPGTDFLRKRADLEGFRRVYRTLLSELRGSHPLAQSIHVFPAVPAPIAVACGHDLLPKVDPALVVYDFVKEMGGFIKRLNVNDHEHK